MKEDDRRPGACFFEIQADIILGDGMGHFSASSWFWRVGSLFEQDPFRKTASHFSGSCSGPKIAVNARDRNAAGLVLFGHEMIAE
jgi:hypothetical protein